jgi:penicillin-binding protein 1C
VPLGGVSGFEAAAWRWFGRRAGELAPAEAALLVAMLPAPSALAPTGGRATELRRRRDRLLAALAAAGRIDATELAAALAEPLPTARRDWPFLAPWFCDAELARRGGGDGRLDTALDLRLQRQVEASVAAQDDAGVDAVAAVVARRTDGAVVAAVGGREWRADRVDATRRARDAGSTLKPLIAALALRDGVAAADQLLVDAPRALHGYAPLNSDGAFVGAVALRSALPQSRNVPAVTLLSQVGLPAFRELLRALELRSAARAADLTAALGTVALSPREMAFAFTRFADPDARLPVAWAQREEVLRMLAAVPLPGMATSRSIAWKTGTSSGRRDAWCVAVAERHVVVSWLGRLDGRGSADLVGSTAAAPLCARIVAGL